MFMKQYSRFALVAALVTVLALVTPGLSLAAGMIGSGPDTAMAPANGMTVHLNAGQQQWYVFDSAGQSQDNDPARISVVLTAMPQGSATFEIWTPERLAGINTQDPNKPVQPVGMGTANTGTVGDQKNVDRSPGMLFWIDRAKVGGTFYVVVKSTGGASDYILDVSGDRLSFPKPAYVMSQPSQQLQPRTLPVTGNAAAPQASTQAAPQPALVRQLGSSPDLALPILGRPTVVPSGQQLWYTFQLPGDSNSGDKPRVQLRLTVQSGGSASFAVWTRERMNQAATADPSQKVGAVGNGTPLVKKDSDGNTFNLYGGDLFWLGNARVGGTYYVLVQATGMAPVSYTLTMTQMNQ